MDDVASEIWLEVLKVLDPGVKPPQNYLQFHVELQILYVNSINHLNVKADLLQNNTCRHKS